MFALILILISTFLFLMLMVLGTRFTWKNQISPALDFVFSIKIVQIVSRILIGFCSFVMIAGFVLMILNTNGII